MVYKKDYYSFNFQIIPEAKVEYLGLEIEKTATMGKNHYNVTDSMWSLQKDMSWNNRCGYQTNNAEVVQCRYSDKLELWSLQIVS